MKKFFHSTAAHCALFVLVGVTLVLPHTARAASDQVLFDFTNPAEVTNWPAANGSWTQRDGMLVANAGIGHEYAFYATRPDYTDVEVQADVLVTPGSYHHPALVVRAGNANNNYICRVNQWSTQPIDGLQLYKKVNNGASAFPVDTGWTPMVSNQWSWMDPAHTKMQENMWYTMKLRAEGNTISCKMWLRGTVEPMWWALQATDSTFSHGMVGVEAYQGEHHFDNVTITPITHQATVATAAPSVVTKVVYVYIPVIKTVIKKVPVKATVKKKVVKKVVMKRIKATFQCTQESSTVFRCVKIS